MKQSISKKILALFLAVLMVVTAVPFMAFAADGVNLTELKTAINAYETKMAGNNGGTIYTNLGPAYEKYLTAKRLYDSVYYGTAATTDADVKKAASELSSATNDMSAYAPQVTANAKAKWTGAGHDNDAEDVALAAEYSNKLLYAGNFNSSDQGEGDSDKNPDVAGALKIEAKSNGDEGHIYSYLQSGDVVMLYDGSTTDVPRYPVWSIVSSWGTKSTSPQIWGIWPGTTSSQDTRFNVNKPYRPDVYDKDERAKAERCGWIGGGETIHWYQDNFDNSAYNYISGDYNHSSLADANAGGAGIGTGKQALDNKKTTFGWPIVITTNWYKKFRYLASTLQYTGTPTAYAENINITWAIDGWDEGTGRTWGQATDNIHNTGVLNWKKIQELAKKASGYPQLTTPQNYMGSSADLKTLYNAIDGVTSFNPNNYSYNNVANAMTTINNTMITADSLINNNAQADSYQELRTAMDNHRAEYEELKSKSVADTIYTTSSYNDYIAAYENAQKFFTSNNTYSDSNGAKTAASNLDVKLVERVTDSDYSKYQEAKDSLELNKNNLDLASLQNAAESIKNANYYNADPYNIPKTDTDALAKEADAITVKPADSTTFDAAVSGLKDAIASSDNNDKFNVAEMKKALEEKGAPVTGEVEINGTEYKGYDYDANVAALQTALSEAMYRYTVKVNGKAFTDNEGNKTFIYGTTVTLPEEAEYKSAVKPGGTNTWMEPVYIGSAKQIVVRGDTELTSCSNAENEKVVKFVSGDRVYDIQSTSEETFDLSTAKVYPPARYTVSGYKIGNDTYGPSETIKLTDKVTEVTVILTANESVGVVTVNDQTYNFGQKVTLTSNTGEFYAKNGDLLWTGDEYTFYARETVNITYTPVEGAEAKNAHTSEAVISNGAAYFHGSISNKENAIAQGMVMDLSGNAKENLTLADVGKDKMILNATAQSIDANTKQYIISMSLPPTARTVTYRAYVAYEVDGKTVYEYSNTTGTFVLEARSN